MAIETPLTIRRLLLSPPRAPFRMKERPLVLRRGLTQDHCISHRDSPFRTREAINFAQFPTETCFLKAFLLCVGSVRVSPTVGCCASIRLMHEFAITGSIARQPLIMAAQSCNTPLHYSAAILNILIRSSKRRATDRQCPC